MKKLTCLLMISICSFVFTNCTNSEASMPDKSLSSVSLAVKKVETKKYNKKIKPFIDRLLEVLKEDAISYDWSDGCRCNVGLLSQIITKKSYIELQTAKNTQYPDWRIFSKENNKKDPHSGSWQSLISYYCGPEKNTMPGVVGEMIEAGFTKEDLVHLEYLSDKNITSHFYRDLDYGNKNDLIAYLEVWRNLIN